MRGAWNLTKTINHLIDKSKDWLSEYYDSKLWEKSSSPKYHSLRYASMPQQSRSWSRSKSRSKSRSLEWDENALFGSITPKFLWSVTS